MNTARTCCCGPSTPSSCDNVLTCAECQLLGSPTSVAIAVTGFSFTYETCSGQVPCVPVTCTITTLAFSPVACVDNLGRMIYAASGTLAYAGCDGTPSGSDPFYSVTAGCKLSTISSQYVWEVNVSLSYPCQSTPSGCFSNAGLTMIFELPKAVSETCVPTADPYPLVQHTLTSSYGPGEEPVPCALCGQAFTDSGAQAFLT